MDKNLLPHISGGWKSKMKVSAELISSQDCEEESAYASFLASGGFAGHLHSSLACGSIDSISAFTWCSQAVCVCLKFPVLSGHLSYWMWAHGSNLILPRLPL